MASDIAVPPLAAIVLAAGEGKRMKSGTHKALHRVAGKAMLDHVLDCTQSAGATRTVVVLGDKRKQLEAALSGRALDYAYQEEQKGTGHAAMMAHEVLSDFNGDIAVVFADTPLIPADILVSMRKMRAADPDMGAVLLAFDVADPTGYGRIIQGADGQVEAIREHRDASEAERAITLCNSGIMLVRGDKFFQWLESAKPDNAAGEIYLTDIIAELRSDGLKAGVIVGDADLLAGVNSRADLADIEATFQKHARAAHMAAGVTLTAPDTVFFSHDTEIGADVTVEPHVVFGVGVRVAPSATIKAFSHLEGADIAEGASVGPYARLRPATHIGAKAKIGNFVEVKKATIEEGAKVSHLSYIGDARVGAGANVGAGTITCNYDGFSKHETKIGNGAFIGSNSALVAPVTIGDGAIVGAGSVITKDVGSDAIAVSRAEEKSLPGAAKRFRDRAAKKS